MRAVDIITKKRDGGVLSQEEIGFLINGFAREEIPNYQVSAWAMAVFLNGMTPEETAALTDAMLRSGKTIDLSGLYGPFVDKHSTGGVGDKTSLILAPVIAALDIKVPMMSGRALGHTGGTLDKLESIPGYRTSLSVDEFRNFLSEVGFAMTGQTREIVPADRLLYALRDVTGTVESIPLITASILSKKAAEGAGGLVLDVKFGSGAFMKEAGLAESLAQSLVDTGTALGLKITALLTDMNEPLGNKVGNFLEVEECMELLEPDYLKSKAAKDPLSLSFDLMEISLELSARMAVLGGKAKDAAEGRKLCEDVLKTGRPKELFLQNVRCQGGNPDELLGMLGNYRSPVKAEIFASKNAYISRIDALKIGQASILLGVGRNTSEDSVCPRAGVEFHHKSGSQVKAGDKIMSVWARDEKGLNSALPGLEDAISYSDKAPKPKQLILKEIP